MDFDNFDFNEQDQGAAERRRESRLLEDEQPLDFEDGDCEGCKI